MLRLSPTFCKESGITVFLTHIAATKLVAAERSENSSFLTNPFSANVEQQILQGTGYQLLKDRPVQYRHFPRCAFQGTGAFGYGVNSLLPV